MVLAYFLWCLFSSLICSLSSLLFLSFPLHTSWVNLHHSGRLSTLSVQESKTSPLLRTSLMVSLNLSIGRPTFLFPSASSPERRVLTALVSGIRATWPNQRNLFLLRRNSISSAFARRRLHRLWQSCTMLLCILFNWSCVLS